MYAFVISLVKEIFMFSVAFVCLFVCLIVFLFTTLLKNI